MNCISCNAPLKPNAKFCTQCGTAQGHTHNAKNDPDNNPQEQLRMIKNKIFWNIQPGEIARSIKEDEFIQYDSAQGIIVNDGTTAYIKSNGKVIAEIHGGNYDFIPSEQLDKILETRVGGAASGFKRGWRGLVNLVMGTKVKDQISNSGEEFKDKKTLDEIIEHLKRGDIFSITLKQDREFQLIFGETHKELDEYANFTPMAVKTKYFDLAVGLRAFFAIKDFNAFSSYYLTDSNVVRTNALANQITPAIQAVLKECLYEVELADKKFPEDIRQKIEDKLRLNDFHGLELKSIVEITAENEDLERLQQLSRELYLSERELDYLHRTNEFRNRLNAVTDDQSVYEKQRELDLYKRLEDINKDNLLTKDEFEKFYMVLSREKRIREATNESEIATALAEIEKTGLLREEDLKIMEDQIAERTYQRGFAVRLMQLKDAEEYEKTRIGSTQNIELQTLEHELNLDRKRAEFGDERFHKEREKSRLENQDEREDIEFMMSISERKRRSQMDSMAEMMRMDSEMGDRETDRRMKEKQQDIDFSLKQQETVHATERERLRRYENMTEDQIRAEQLRDLSDDAQQEYMRSLAAGKDSEKEKELREEQMRFMEKQMESQLKTQEGQMDRQERMQREMMQAMAQVSGNIAQSGREQKEEYRSQLHREQDRHDRHQDTALNYTTRPQNSPAAGQQAANAVSAKECPKCKKIYSVSERFCEDCGCEI